MSNVANRAERLFKARERLHLPVKSLAARVKVLRAAASLKVASERQFVRHLRLARIARNRDRARSQLLFAKGATAEKIGYLEEDDYAILGLEAHGVLYALWIARAAMECEAHDRGMLLRRIFSCPRRLHWCRTEGARVANEFGRLADEAKTRAFLERQAKSGSKNWRKEPVTEHQIYQIELIAVRLGIPVPHGLRCGTAHDWIAVHKANTAYWQAPESLPDWEL